MKAKKQDLFQDRTTQNSKLSRFEKKLVPFARDCSIHLDPAPWASEGGKQHEGNQSLWHHAK